MARVTRNDTLIKDERVKPKVEGGIYQVAPAEEGGGASSEQIREFAQKQGMSETAAASALQRFTDNPKAPEFRLLRPEERAALQQATQRLAPVRTGENVITVGQGETISKEQYDKVKDELGSYAASVLKDKGIKAFREYTKGGAEFQRQIAADIKQKADAEIKASEAAYNELKSAGALTASGQLDVAKAVKQNISRETMLKAGFSGVTTDDIKKAKEYNSTPKPSFTLAPLPPVEVKTPEARRGDWWYKGKQITNEERDRLISDYETKRQQLVKEGKIYTDEWYSLGENPQNTTYRATGIKDTVEAILKQPKEAPQYWYQGALISQEERDQIIDNYNAKRKALLKSGQGLGSVAFDQLGPNPANEIGKASTKKQRDLATFAADILVPGFYTVRNWNEMDAGEKAWAITADALILFSYAGAATRGARAVATAGKLERIGAAARAVGQEALLQGKAPFYMVVHPVETAKGLTRQAQHIVEYIVDPRKLKNAVITTTDGTIRLKVSQATSEAEAKKIADKLAELAAKGERPVVEINGVKYELARSPLMRELGGGLAHASPQGEAFAEGLKVETKFYPGTEKPMPKSEQGLFVSPEPLPRFAKSSAFGATGEKPIIYITSPETAEKMAVSTGKLYKAPKEGLVAELEKKFPVGAELPKPKQKLTFRTGPELQKVEIWLEKPLTAKQLTKLKLEGFIEEIKTVFRPAISISGKAKAGGMTTADIKRLSTVIDDARANRTIARSLERNAESIARIARELPRVYGETAITTRAAAAEPETLETVRADTRETPTATREARPPEPRRQLVITDAYRRPEIRDALERISRRGEPRRIESDIQRTRKEREAEREAERVIRNTLPPRERQRIERLEERARKARTPREREQIRGRIDRIIRDNARRIMAERTPRRPRGGEPPRVPRMPRPPAPPPRVPPPRREPPPDEPPPEKGKGKKKLSDKGEKERAATMAGKRLIAAWPQGFGWRLVYKSPDGTIAQRFIYGQRPPSGIENVEAGQGEAKRGIQSPSGKFGKASIKMGAVNVELDNPPPAPGDPGAISFTPNRVSDRPPQLSKRQRGIGGKGLRITPRTPKLR